MNPSTEHADGAHLDMVRCVLRGGVLGPHDSAAMLYDLDALAARHGELSRAFPPGVLHAVAVKAAPLPGLLRLLAGLGAGLEAASLPELALALDAGCPPERIVFDSPAKTVEELALALERGVGVNADNLEELARLDALLARGASTRAPLGLRVNPQVGAGSIAATSVADEYSKFGEPICKADEIVAAFRRYPWLGALHLHVGSQGCPPELMVRGVRRVLDLALRINRECGPGESGTGRVTRLDLGGGLAVAYRPGQGAPSMAAYARELYRVCPELADLEVVTEFGRWMFAGAGVAISRVEYVKRQPGHRTAVIHLGADMFLRPCYAPDTWYHQVLALSPDGEPKPGPLTPCHVAGPLCFSGDFPARDRALPPLEPGDWLAFLDAGAYSLGMWSRYNSRQMPVVLGVDAHGARVLKPRESVEDVLRFWGA